MEYPSLNVASYIANLCKENGIAYNNSKIQRLMYCCYGSVLAAYGDRLCDEYPKAWDHGPLFPKAYGYMNKGKEILYISPRLENMNVPELLVDVVKKFGEFSASSLSRWTRIKGSPWDIVVNDMEAPNSIIPDKLILDYFKQNVMVMEETKILNNDEKNKFDGLFPKKGDKVVFYSGAGKNQIVGVLDEIDIEQNTAKIQIKENIFDCSLEKGCIALAEENVSQTISRNDKKERSVEEIDRGR
jgi:uncharacterized phage-associated protein